VTGAIFGFFHVDLFRILPTAFLGVVLGAIVLISGSIFPAMLWHTLNNSVALVPAYFGVTIEYLPLWSFGLGLLGLALAFWILWRNRLP
jgi:membrane protease YdiL (CAAX protease family)